MSTGTIQTQEYLEEVFVAGWRIASEFIGASRWRCQVTPIEEKPYSYHVIVTERNEKGEYQPTQFWIDLNFGAVLPSQLVARIGGHAFTAFSNAWFEKRFGEWNG